MRSAFILTVNRRTCSCYLTSKYYYNYILAIYKFTTKKNKTWRLFEFTRLQFPFTLLVKNIYRQFVLNASVINQLSTIKLSLLGYSYIEKRNQQKSSL